jgi:hypothetical protein
MPRERLATALIIGLATGFVILGALTVGGPEEARKAKRDDIRLRHMAEIGACLQQLSPSALSAIGDTLDAGETCAEAAEILDPLTAKPYRVALSGATGIRICAEFESKERQGYTFGIPEFDRATGCASYQRASN